MTFFFLFAAAALASDFQGQWQGIYHYDDGRAPVEFQMPLFQSGDQIHGGVIEPKTFDCQEGTELNSRFTGSLAGEKISFRKTYTCADGRKFAIQYDGQREGNLVYGKWLIDESCTGTFKMSWAPPGLQLIENLPKPPIPRESGVSGTSAR